MKAKPSSNGPAWCTHKLGGQLGAGSMESIAQRGTETEEKSLLDVLLLKLLLSHMPGTSHPLTNAWERSKSRRFIFPFLFLRLKFPIRQ